MEPAPPAGSGAPIIPREIVAPAGAPAVPWSELGAGWAAGAADAARRERAAYHEAGHAVLAAVLGVAFVEVRLNRAAGWGGWLELAPGPAAGERDGDREALLWVLQAGEVAQRRRLGAHARDDEACRRDRSRAADLADRLRRRERREAYWARAEARVAGLVAAHWSAVRAVATALGREGRLPCARVEALVREAPAGEGEEAAGA